MSKLEHHVVSHIDIFQIAYAPTAVDAFLKILAMDMILLESQDLQTQRTVYSMVVSLAQIFQVWKFLHYIIDSFCCF